MKNSKNGKRPALRSALAALLAIERANADMLGIDECNARVRRYVAEHDAPADDNIAFERLCTAILSQGLGFATVDRHRDALLAAFQGFVPTAVASIEDVSRLLQQPIIRNRAKVEACIENARSWIKLAGEHGTYLGRVAHIATDDEPVSGWPLLTATLCRDFRRLREPSARLALKRWGFFTALPHPGSARLLTRLAVIKNEDAARSVQCFVAKLAQAAGKDPYSVEAALALFAGLGPCKAEPACAGCVLNEDCPSAVTSAV